MDIIESIYEKQEKYGYIKEMHISREISGEECSDYALKISLCDYPCWDDKDTISLVFTGVRDLKIGDMNGLYQVFLGIQRISERQMEDINYAVAEVEGDLISFFCKDIKLV